MPTIVAATLKCHNGEGIGGKFCTQGEIGIIGSTYSSTSTSTVPSGLKLNELNYPFWSKILETHIASRGKKWFLMGNVKEPSEGSAEFEMWKTRNAIVKEWLINSVEPIITRFFIHLRTAKECRRRLLELTTMASIYLKFMS